MLDQTDIGALARAANLPLSAERIAIISPILNIWLRDGAELNRKMSGPAYREILPIATFTHPRRP